MERFCRGRLQIECPRVSQMNRIELGADPLVIGRLGTCDITVDDRNVSREHAEVRAEGDSYVVVDLGSTNGTLLNEAVIGEMSRLMQSYVDRGRSTPGKKQENDGPVRFKWK